MSTANGAHPAKVKFFRVKENVMIRSVVAIIRDIVVNFVWFYTMFVLGGLYFFPFLGLAEAEQPPTVDTVILAAMVATAMAVVEFYDKRREARKRTVL